MTAIMSKQLIMTNKLLDIMAIALDDKTRALCLEGPARSSKTALAIQIFYYKVISSNEQRHAIAGRDLDAIRDNILKADVVGLITTHPEIKLEKGRIGGYYLSVPSSNGEKIVSLVNYSDTSAWKKVLGGTLGVIFIDECNIANDTFLQETFARQISADSPLTIMTTNGDNPDAFIYKNYYNYCRRIGDCPNSTRKYMIDFHKKYGIKDGYYYAFFDMSDNPSLTPEKIEAAKSIYPVGSYYYTTKILGERGTAGSLIFNDYMSQDLIVNAYERDSYGRLKYEFDYYTIGMDVAETRATNTIILTGWTRGYKHAIFLKCDTFTKVGYKFKKDKLFAFVSFFLETLGIPSARCRGILIDSAEQNFIADMNADVYDKFHIDVVGSYKMTILERINLMILGFSTKRILFHNTPDVLTVYNSYRNALWVEGKEGKEREDKNEPKNDVMDGAEYSITRFYKEFRAAGGIYK